MRSLWANIFRLDDEARERRHLLRAVPLFEALSTREIDVVERVMYRRTYAPGETIFRQGDPGAGMYVVLEGTVEIVTAAPARVLVELHHGDFFGEIALLNETPRSAGARTPGGCTLLGFFRPELLDLVHRHPAMGVKILLPLARMAGQRLLRADRELQALESNAAPRRARKTPLERPSGEHATYTLD